MAYEYTIKIYKDDDVISELEATPDEVIELLSRGGGSDSEDEVEEEVAAAPKKKRKATTCKNCGEKGHTRKTCQFPKKSDPEAEAPKGEKEVDESMIEEVRKMYVDEGKSSMYICTVLHINLAKLKEIMDENGIER